MEIIEHADKDPTDGYISNQLLYSDDRYRWES